MEQRRFDLVLLDLMLPGISGYELLEYIRSDETPVIIISAMAGVQDRIHGLRMGGRTTISASRFRLGSCLHALRRFCAAPEVRTGS